MEEGILSKAAVPFLLTELRLALKPAEESRLWPQTVAVTSRLKQLDLSDHLKLLQRRREGCQHYIKHCGLSSSCDNCLGVIKGGRLQLHSPCVSSQS